MKLTIIAYFVLYYNNIDIYKYPINLACQFGEDLP